MVRTHPVAVIGATGHQGGAVVEALLDRCVPVRALVRDMTSPAAEDLGACGVELVEADQEDPDALAQALAGVSGLFFHTTYVGPDGSEGEVRRGVHVIDAAVVAQVPYVVYSSVGGAERETGVSFFDSKEEVERYLLSHIRAKVLRPVFFMENLLTQLLAQDKGDIVLSYPMPGTVPVQLIAVRDIGRAAAQLLVRQDDFGRRSLEIGGDEKTLEEMATVIADVLGRPARFEELSPDVLGTDEDLHAMFRWFSRPRAYRADFALTRELVPDLLDLRRWLGTYVHDDRPTADD